MAIIKRGSSYGVRIWDPVTKSHEWLASFHIRDYGGSHREAKLAAEQCELDAKQSVVKIGRETCGEFAKRYPDAYNRVTKDGPPRWGKKTLADKRYALRPFIARFGSVPLRRFPIAEARPWAATQPLKYVATVRAMFNDAVRDGLAPSNPFANLGLPQSRGRKDLVVLTEAELEDLIELGERIHTRFGSTFAAMIAMAGYVGLRPGEMFALRPGDIDLAKFEVHIQQNFNGFEFKRTKNERNRRVVVPPPAAHRLELMPRKLKAEWLFEPPTRNTHFRKTSLHHYWSPVRAAFDALLSPARAAELRASRGGKDFAWAEFRHTAATILLERGLTPERVAFQLGHTDGGKLIRETYGHPDDARFRREILAGFGSNVVDITATSHGASEVENG